jgi:hypothetical protein
MNQTWMSMGWKPLGISHLLLKILLKYFNSPEMQGEFSYGCKAVVCEDKTKFPKRQVDRAFLDVPRSFQKKMLKLKYQIQC